MKTSARYLGDENALIFVRNVDRAILQYASQFTGSPSAKFIQKTIETIRDESLAYLKNGVSRLDEGDSEEPFQIIATKLSTRQLSSKRIASIVKEYEGYDLLHAGSETFPRVRYRDAVVSELLTLALLCARYCEARKRGSSGLLTSTLFEIFYYVTEIKTHILENHALRLGARSKGGRSDLEKLRSDKAARNLRDAEVMKKWDEVINDNPSWKPTAISDQVGKAFSLCGRTVRNIRARHKK